MEEIEIGARLVLAVVLGGAIGVERELDGQDAGFRTHVLLALGAALFGAVSVAGFDEFLGNGNRSDVRIDPSRVASYVAAGIGFLGGGAIIKHAGAVHGMTTASSIWTTAAIGLSAGIGFYVGAVTGAVLALAVLRLLKPLSRRIEARARVPALTLAVSSDRAVSVVLAAIRRVDQRAIGRVDIGERTPSGDRQVRLSLVSGTTSEAAHDLLARLETALGADLSSASLEQ